MNCKTMRAAARLLGGVAATAIAFSSAQALAEAAAAADTQMLEEIVVIGVTKQEANLQETPIAITAFSGEKLEAQGIREVGEVASFTPGFNIRAGNNNPTGFALAMRGQVQNDQIASLEPSVGIYIDEMYIARAYGLNVDMLDVGSVQVLKGPQGTLFGRNTSAGAMLIQTNDAKFGETSGTVKATYGRFNQWNTTGIVNLALGDNLALRGALSYGERDGFVRDIISGKKWNGTKTLNGRLKLAWKPADNITVSLSGDWYDGEIDGQARQGLALVLNPYLFVPGGLTPEQSAAQVAALQAIADANLAQFAGHPDRVAVTPASSTPGAPEQGVFNDMKTQTYMAKLAVETGFGEVRWINGYRQVKGDNLQDLDGFILPLHFTNGTQNLKQYSTELQLTGAGMEDRLQYAAGLTYFRETGTDQSRTSVLGDPRWSRFLGKIDNNSYGAYGQVSYAATDALTLTGGLRYSIDDKGIKTYSGTVLNRTGTLIACSPASVSVATNCERGRSDTWKNLSYTVGVDYKINDDIMIYAKQSRGYRAGAQQLRSLTLADSTPAEPEIVNEQEIGVKTEFLDRKVRLNVAGYHNKVKDAQRSVILAIAGTSQTVLENADVETWGVEADLNIRVTQGLNIFANGSLSDPKYTKYNGFAVIGGVLTPDDKKDTRMNSIIKKQFMVGMNYEQEVGIGTLTFNATYAWQGDMAQDNNTFERYTRPLSEVGGQGFTAEQARNMLDVTTTKSHGITNARLGLSFGEDEAYEVAVWGKNIFDVRRTGYVLYLGGLNYAGASWNDPATYGVTLTAKF